MNPNLGHNLVMTYLMKLVLRELLHLLLLNL